MVPAEQQAIYFADFCSAFQEQITPEAIRDNISMSIGSPLWLFSLAVLAMNYFMPAIPGIDIFFGKCSLLSAMNVICGWIKATTC
jgi:hypothetical protein